MAEKYLGERLGDFVATSRWEDLPPTVGHEAKRSLLNFLGCAVGAAHTEPVETAMRVLSQLSGEGRVAVFGRSDRLDPLGAAFTNAIGANLLDYDDTHLRTVIHPTAPVAPAALGLAEQHGLTGAEILHGFVLGAEIECRIGNAVSPHHYARGWHITSTCGVFGSAVASAKLLGLSAGQIWHALGIASSQSAGTVENLPNGAKNVSVGNAARNGIFAALLAQQGYDAAPAALEGALGWARAMGDELVEAHVLNGLGEQWELLQNTYKPYPCGIVMHAVIDACLALRQEHTLQADQIAEIIISGDQLLLDRGDRIVMNERDSRVSIHHCAAVAFLYGKAGLTEFAEPVVHDAAVVALRNRTKAKLNAGIGRGGATAKVKTVDGRILEATVLHARGSTQIPLTDHELEEKVRELVRHAGYESSAEDMISAVWQLDRLDSIAPLLKTIPAR
jgi:2-methylcitrate dehydratase PrpD